MMRWLAIWLLLAPALASADGRKMLGAHEQDAWSSVGRLNFGDGFCTGALVAPDLVATAAHCLYAPRTGNARPVDRIHFVAGYRLRKFAGHEKASRTVQHPEYVYSPRINAKAVATDVALITLKAPLSLPPFAIAPGLAAGDEVSILSYGRDRPEIPSIQSPCAVVLRDGGVAVLACDVTYGVSGAPVFREIDGAWRIVAIISGMGTHKGQKVAYAAVLEEALPPVFAAP